MHSHRPTKPSQATMLHLSLRIICRSVRKSQALQRTSITTILGKSCGMDLETSACLGLAGCVLCANPMRALTLTRAFVHGRARAVPKGVSNFLKKKVQQQSWVQGATMTSEVLIGLPKASSEEAQVWCLSATCLVM